MFNENQKKMLAIFAHPDDESFAAGGTLAKYAQRGVQVSLLCATRGEAGIPGLTPKEAGRIREQELRAAAEQLGIEVIFLGYRDGELTKADPSRLLRAVKNKILRINPQVIITFGPDGVSGHPDHVTISQAVTQAYDQSYRKGLLLYVKPSEATSLGCGVNSSTNQDDMSTLTVDITDYKLSKIRAIQCHRSQKPELHGEPEEEVNNIPCFEAFSVARINNAAEASAAWFETSGGQASS